MGFKTLWKRQLTCDIAKDQLGESFYKEWIPFIGTLFFLFSDVIAGAVIPWKLIELPQGELAAPMILIQRLCVSI
jgi:hypothetical protein